MLPRWQRILNRRALRHLRGALAADEMVRRVGAGNREDPSDPMVLAATDRRLLGATLDGVEEWSYETLSSAVGEDEDTLVFSDPDRFTTVRCMFGRAEAVARAINEGIDLAALEARLSTASVARDEQDVNTQASEGSADPSHAIGSDASSDSPDRCTEESEPDSPRDWIAQLEESSDISWDSVEELEEIDTLSFRTPDSRIYDGDKIRWDWELHDGHGLSFAGSFTDQELSDLLHTQWEEPAYVGERSTASVQGQYWLYRGRFFRLGPGTELDPSEADAALREHLGDAPPYGKDRLDAFQKRHLPEPSLSSAQAPRLRREAIPQHVKDRVWRRDSAQCSRCGSRERLEFDHIVPVSKGGSNTERNIELLCEPCNRRKAASI